MNEAAVMPRGNAVAATATDMSGTAGRTDGRNRRAAETRRTWADVCRETREAWASVAIAEPDAVG